MPSLLQDLRFALRLFRRTPGVTAVAVLSLALGVGANAAIFSVVDALGFRPLPVPDEQRLVRVYATGREEGRGRLSYKEFDEIRQSNHVFSGVMVHGLRGASVTDARGDTEVVAADVVSGDYFTTLGVVPALGRPFRKDEEFRGSAPVVIISHSLWQRRFGGDPAVVGKTVNISATPCTLIGVAKPEFYGTAGLQSVDLWVPVETWSVLGRKGNRRDFEDHSAWLDFTGRLRPGVTEQQALAELGAIGRRLAQAWPDTNKSRGFGVMREAEARRQGFSTAALILLAIVALVLLIACANVAGLLLGRAEARRHELGVRLALGASRGRLLRQLLMESALLGVMAGVAGCVFGAWVVRLLPALLPPTPIRLGLVFQLDARLIAITLGIAVLATPLFGVVPALLASRSAILPSLRGGRTGTDHVSRVTMRDALVVAQVALSAVLLLGAGLLVRSLVKAQEVNIGFDRSPALVMTIVPQLPGSPSPEDMAAFYRELVDRAGALPDARGATLTSRVPLSPFGGGATQQVVVPGWQMAPGQDALSVRFSIVDDRYFDVMGTRLLRGRRFARTDANGPRVVVVSEAMARRYWPSGGAVGARIQVGPPGRRDDYEVIGVAQDVKQNAPTEDPQSFLYFLRGQKNSGDLTLFVRTSNERAASDEVKGLLRQMAPGSPTLRMVTLDEHLHFALYEHRVVAVIVSVLGGVGLLLATIGLYGVVAYLVSRRTREIGIRLALGATPRHVMGDVVGRALILASLGLAFGVAGGLSLGGAIRRLLFGVTLADPVTLAGVAAIVCSVAVCAAYVPARRAARVDPVTTLRTE